MNRPLLSCAALAAAAFLASACDRETTQRAETDARQAGKRIEQALDRTGEKITAAAQKTEDRIAEGSQRMAPKVEAAGDRIGDAAHRTGEKISSVTTSITSGEKSSLSTTGIPDETKAKLADATITASIKAGLFRDRDLSALKVDVDTRDGVVTLNGVAPDDAAKHRAGQIAQGTKGVRGVRNHLTLKQG